MKQMSKLVVIWHSIWYFRNQAIFNKNNCDGNSIVGFIDRHIKEWSRAKSEEEKEVLKRKKQNQPASQNRKKKNIKWENPPSGYYKLNFDGSILPDGRASIGFVIRDNLGKVISLKGEAIPPCSVFKAETEAARRGIKEARDLKIERIIIEGDNLGVINALKGDWNSPWEEELLIADPRLDLRNFRTISIRHVFREVNCVADRVAFLGHTTPTDNPDCDLEL